MVTAVEHVREIPSERAAEALEFAAELAREYTTVAHPELVERAPALARELSGEIRSACRQPDPALGLFVMRGFTVDDDALGATPSSWAVADPEKGATWDVLMLLLASAMGNAFGWDGQQDGRLVHNIVPSKGSEQEQTGASSSVLLSPHTEDAFHPSRANLLMLGCMRNRERIGTTAACVRAVSLDEADYAELARPTLPVLPDDSYGDDHTGAGSPPPVPTLWRTGDGLCLRYDPAYTPLRDAGPAYRAAYERLGTELERVSGTVQLAPGEVLVVDNDAVVHGRVPFTARYDGTDRWLKRVNVRTRDHGRPAGEAAEHGYGQRVVDPYAA
jgi:hypothetical protein